MKPASDDLKAFLASVTEYVKVDVITFELLGGDDDNYRLYLTTGQHDLTVAPVDGSPGTRTYRGNVAIVSGLRARASIGLAVDEGDCTLTPLEGATIQGLTFQEAARRRLFDSATVRRDRFYFERFGQPPIGGVPMFSGLVGQVRLIGGRLQMKVRSAKGRLDQPMPRHLHQPTCIYTIYDGGCGLDRTALAIHGTVGVGATRSIIPTDAADPSVSLGIAFFETLGAVGQRRTVRAADGANLVLAYPLPEAPEAGTLVTCYPGCDGSLATCTALGNTARRRSYDKVPQPETAI